MQPEEKRRLLAKWAVWHCPWDNVRQTNMPTTIVSPYFDTREEAEQALEQILNQYDRGQRVIKIK